MPIQSFYRRRCYTIICILSAVFLLSILINSTGPKYKMHNEQTRYLLKLAENESLCSERSARRGLNQRVLSVSAYESNDNIPLKTSITWTYIKIFVSEARRFYPSWIVRVYYYNLKNKTKDDFEKLEKLNDNLDFCDVENLPVLGDIRYKLPGKMQRFLPAIDPFVDITMVRDLDSEIFEREVQAVKEWLTKTTYAFHIMRDHYYHNIHMLGGLWGVAANRLSMDDRLALANALLPPTNKNDRDEFLKMYSGRGDQLFLTHHIWPLARQNSLAHDSFTCLWSRYIYREDTRPFPSRREHPSCFVGCPKPCCTFETKNNTDYSKFKECPSTCRPEEHKDWLFC